MPSASPSPPPVGSVIRGLHLRAGGDGIQGFDEDCLKVSGIEAVKFTTEIAPNTIDRLRSLYGVEPDHCVVRLFTPELANRIVPPEEYCSWFIEPIKEWMAHGVYDFEIHNEPNLPSEWCGTADEFAMWYDVVRYTLQNECLQANFGFPGLSPQPNVDDWLNRCSMVIQASDWVGIHAYWQTPDQLDHPEHGGYWRRYVQKFPHQRFLITEFCNNSDAVSKAIKGQQYVEYWRQLPDSIEAAYCFISSSDNPDFADQTWANEDGSLTEIPFIVGESVPIPTPTTTPSLPPDPDYSRPESMGGVHVIVEGSHTGYGQFLRDCGRSLFVKSFFDFGALMEAKTIHPNTVAVIRVRPEGIDEDTPPGNWQWPVSETKKIALDWMSRCYPILDRNGRQWFDYVEVLNEPDPADAAAMERAVPFVQYCMEDADAHGYKLAIWSWTAGLPRTPRLSVADFEQMELTLPTLVYAADHGHAYAIHEGSVNPDRRLIRQAAEDMTALRYRITAQMMNERGWPMPPVVVTEAYQLDGYKSPDWNDWKWYWSELAKDPYVLGAAWFTLGDWSFGEDNINIVNQLPGLSKAIASMPPRVSEEATL